MTTHRPALRVNEQSTKASAKNTHHNVVEHHTITVVLLAIPFKRGRAEGQYRRVLERQF